MKPASTNMPEIRDTGLSRHLSHHCISSYFCWYLKISNYLNFTVVQTLSGKILRQIKKRILPHSCLIDVIEKCLDADQQRDRTQFLNKV